jgi:hypothetical protein
LSGDLTEKHGQIAHLDQEPSNCTEDNLAFMCLVHHSLYDSHTSQHKNYTIAEVKVGRVRLYEAIAQQEHCTAGDPSRAHQVLAPKPNIAVEQHSTAPDSPNVATFGNNSPVTITKTPNPYAAIVWYDFNGVKHIQEGTSSEAILGEEYTVFPRFEQLHTERKWQELIELCDEQITKYSEWLTPYLFAGVGCANLNKKDKAIDRLEYVEKKAGNNKAYEDASRIVHLLRNAKPQ